MDKKILKVKKTTDKGMERLLHEDKKRDKIIEKCEKKKPMKKKR